MSIVKRLGRIGAMTLLTVVSVGGLLRLTGAVHYLVTSGISMTPLYHGGDLVVVLTTSRFHVGQIAAYHSRLLNTTVLHRIVSTSGGSYTFKGDHNTWLDPESPNRTQLIGRAWLHIPHGGALLALHGAPVILLVGGAIAALVVLTPHSAAEAAPRTQRRRPSRCSLYHRVTVGLLATEAIFCAGLAVSFLSGTTTYKPRQLPTVETSTFSYTAQVAPDSVYPSGRIQSGDPVFVRVVPRIEVSYVYQASGAAAPSLNGTTRLTLTLSCANGWRTETPLGPAVSVAAGHAQANAELDLDRIESMLSQVRDLTGVDTGTVNLTVHANNAITGGPNVSDQFDVPMAMQLTPTQLSAAASPSGEPAGHPALTTSRLLSEAPVPNPKSEPRPTRLLQAARLPIIGVIVIVALATANRVFSYRPRHARATGRLKGYRPTRSRSGRSAAPPVEPG